MELDIFEGLESILDQMLKFKLIKSLNLKQTQMKTENSKMIGNFKEIFALQSTLSWTVLLKDDQEELFKLL